MDVEGELVQASPWEERSQQEVVLQFPVEVVVVGGMSDEEKQALETRIWDSLKEALS